MTTSTSVFDLYDPHELAAMAPEGMPKDFWGQGTPGDFGDFNDVNKGSLYRQVDATDDQPHVWMKVDEGSDTDDWVALFVNKSLSPLQVGVFNSSTTGSIALDATNSVGFGVYVDDGGAAVASSVLMRAGRFRTLLTYTAGNREQEAVGAIGQINSVGGTNRHNMGGLMGSYELSGTSTMTVDGQAYTTDSWIQAGVIGRVGVGSAKTTINSNGVLAGVAAMSNTTSFVANNGVYAGFYAGRWGGSALAQWEYGIYAQDVAHGGYFNVDAGAVSGEEHAFDIANTGTLSSGDSLVGLNIVSTAAGTAGSWFAGLYVKATQASKMVNGYLCAAEFELASTAANASDNSVIVLNSTSNHSGSPPAATPYITLREYGTTYANVFLRIFNDTGQSGTTDATTLITTSADKAATHLVRCMLGSTVFWLLGTTTTPS